MRPGQVSLPFMILPPKAKIKDVTVSGNSMTVLVEDQSSTGTEGYRFRYRKKGSGEWTEVSGAAGSTSVTIDGLASGEQYEVCAGGYVTVPEDKRSAQIREPVYYGQDSDTVISGRIPEGLAGKEVSLSAVSYTYNGKVHIPSVESIGGLTLKEGTDYTPEVTDSKGKAVSSPIAAGKYTITITGKGNYTGKTSATYTIKKAANPLRIKAGTVTLKAGVLKDKKQTLKRSRVVKIVRKGKGTITYTKARGNKNITISKKSGKVTVKKGLKKGVYRVKVWVSAKGSANYKAGRRGTIFTIKVK